MGPAIEIELDVSEAVGVPARLAGTYFPPQGEARAVLVGLPGGTYNRGYFDLEVTGHPGYSFAAEAVASGFGLVVFDQLGTGASSRPDRDIGLEDQARAAAAAVAQFPAATGRHLPCIGVGHSMGGYVAMLQQAADHSYAALAVLGTTNQYVAPLDLPPEMIAAASTPEGRAALVDQIHGAFTDRYALSSRDPMRSWFHLADVPEAVVQADTAATLTVVPSRAGAEASVPGITAGAAARIDVPVFLAYGEVDVSPDPHREVAFFPASRDVTLYLLAGSGHCHNMSATRHALWRRLLRWCETVLGRGG